MSFLPQVLFLVIFSSVFVLRLQADDTGGHDNVGIIGGYVAHIEDNPFMVSVLAVMPEYKYMVMNLCGGSIIHERFILTAAHCVLGELSDLDLQVRMGSDRWRSGGVLVDVEARLCHNSYHLIYHDICLLKLKEPVQFGDKVALVDLPDKDIGFEGFEGRMVNATGWGSTTCNNETESEIMRQAMFPLESDQRCKRIYFGMSEAMLCGGGYGNNVYKGDSGGPVTIDNIQIAVMSFVTYCNYAPAFYTKVSSYLNWINTTITRHL